MLRTICITLALLCSAAAGAQNHPERGLVRKGNRQFDKGDYLQSARRYEQALEAAPGNFEATYDLGGALYRTEAYDKAAQSFAAAAADTLRTDEERAEAFYNSATPGSNRNSTGKRSKATSSRFASTPPTRRPNTITPTPNGCSTSNRISSRIRTRTRTKIRIRTKAARESRIPNRESRATSSRRIGRIRARSRRTAGRSRTTKPERRASLSRASPRRSRNGCSTPFRPRRTRPRRRSRSGRAPWCAAAKTGNAKTIRP